MRLIGTFVALFSCAGLASADNCRAPVRQTFVQKHVAAVQQIINPVAIATYVPVPVAVPQYSVGYNAEGDSALAVRELTAEIKRLRETLAVVGPATKPTEPDNSVSARVTAIMDQRCAKCHVASVAVEKGGGHVLLAEVGKLADGLDWTIIEDEVNSGRMPKGGPELPDDEYRVFKEMQREQLKIQKAQKKMESGS